MADKPSVTRNIIITAHRHINHLALINLRRGKAECCREGQFPRCGNLTFTAAILPRIGGVPWGRFCIFREGERGRGKNERQRGGGCMMPHRGQAPVPPNSLSFSPNPFSSRYKLDDFVEMQLKIGTLLSERQLVMHSILSHFRLNAECSRTFPPNLPSAVPSDNSRRPCILPDSNPSYALRAVYSGVIIDYRSRRCRLLPHLNQGVNLP